MGFGHVMGNLVIPSCKLLALAGSGCDQELYQEADLALCADLEAIADGLPDLPEARDLSRLTCRLIEAAQRWSGASRPGGPIDEPLLLHAWALDSVHAEDVIDALWSHWRDPGQTGASTLSYMLRALFDGRRRAIALERLALGCSSCQSSDSA